MSTPCNHLVPSVLFVSYIRSFSRYTTLPWWSVKLSLIALKIVAVIAEINFLEKEEFLLTHLIKLMLCYPTLVDKIGLSTCYWKILRRGILPQSLFDYNLEMCLRHLSHSLSLSFSLTLSVSHSLTLSYSLSLFLNLHFSNTWSQFGDSVSKIPAIQAVNGKTVKYF